MLKQYLTINLNNYWNRMLFSILFLMVTCPAFYWREKFCLHNLPRFSYPSLYLCVQISHLQIDRDFGMNEIHMTHEQFNALDTVTS